MNYMTYKTDLSLYDAEESAGTAKTALADLAYALYDDGTEPKETPRRRGVVMWDDWNEPARMARKDAASMTDDETAPVDYKALARAELDLMTGADTAQISPENRDLLVRHVEETRAGYWHEETGRLFELAEGTEEEWKILLKLDEEIYGPRNPKALGDSACDPWRASVVLNNF